MPDTVRYLVVDEALTVARRARVHLQQVGVHPDHILEAITAEEALTFFREKDPDVALVALELPDRPGHEVAQEMLSRDPQTHVVLVAEAPRDDPRVIEAVQAGVAAVLDKPVRENRVETLLRALGQGSPGLRRIPPSE